MSYHFVTTFLFLRPAKEKERQNLTFYRSFSVLVGRFYWRNFFAE